MLTLDLMRSRNLSQTLRVSGSRPIWVAVVIIMREVEQQYISTGVKNLWKAILSLKRHALEFLPAQERVFCAPVVPRSPFRFAGPRSTASKLEGFSRTVRSGARKKCAKPSTNVHMPFTTFPQAPEMCKCIEKCRESGEK